MFSVILNHPGFRMEAEHRGNTKLKCGPHEYREAFSATLNLPLSINRMQTSDCQFQTNA